MPGIDVDSPLAAGCVEFAARVGLPHILMGHGSYGHGQPRYVELAATDDTTMRTLAAARERGIVVGSIEPCRDPGRWLDEEGMARDLADPGTWLIASAAMPW
jgi:hypothetical protein